MFAKAYRSRTQTPLSSSQKRQFRQTLEKCFPSASAEELQTLLPSKSNVSQTKILTASNVPVSIFCIDRLPMFFEIDIDGQDNQTPNLVPTLYALWTLPTLLPYFTTFADVLPRLSNGADLMLPGVIPNGTGMNKYGRYRKGQLVAVNLNTNTSAVGVGMLTRSSDDLYMCGGQGSAVKMLHLFGDKLWGHEPTLIQQVPNKPPKPTTGEDFPALGATVNKKEDKKQIENKPIKSLPIEDFPALGATSDKKNNQSQKDTESTEQSAECDVENVTIEQLQITDSDDPQIEADTVAPEVLLKNAFLAALKNKGKSMPLPLLTSNFFRLYVLPEANESIDIKKTKYKKLSNFLTEMAKEGFIVVKEESKGVDKITSINLEHEEIINFITDFKPPMASNVEGESTNQPLFHSELTELYVVTDATAAFFTRMNYKRGEGIPVAQIKKIIREYISKNELAMDPLTKCIRLDETLQKLCNCTEATSSQICSLVIKQMDHSYQMCTIKDNSSNKPLIQMSLATRSGNKKVTLVSNLECYGIILPEFIKLCKQGAAASTTIVKLPNQKREQLQIQGNQVRFIYNLLTETYKVPPKSILGIELAKDGKKHKKK